MFTFVYQENSNETPIREESYSIAQSENPRVNQRNAAAQNQAGEVPAEDERKITQDGEAENGVEGIAEGEEENEREMKQDNAKEGEKVKDIIVSAVATIGEKITLRRVSLVEKTDSQVFGAYTHMNGKIVVLTVLEGGTEEVAKDVCMHIAAMNPKYIDKSYVDAEFLASETEILRQETLNEGKPEKIVDKIVEGKVHKMLKSICLVDQPYVKNEDITVGEYVHSNKAEIKQYIRLAVGEGIEKRKDDYLGEISENLAKMQQNG